MSMSIGSGKVTASIVGSSPTTILTAATASRNSAGSSTLATVTAGKTAYVVGGNLTIWGSVSAAEHYHSANLAVNGVVIGTVAIVERGSGFDTNTQSLSINLPAGYVITAAAGQTLTLSLTTSGGTVTCFGTIFYYEA